MRRALFVVLCVSVWINYMDRGNLSVSAPALQPEMNLSPTEMGILLSGFFWTYSLLQPVAGWLVERYDVYRLYAAAFAVWSLAVAAGGLATTFTALLLSRLVLGIGESLAYPAYSRMLAGNFSEERRGFANAMIDVGTKAGPALGTFLGALAVQAFGWRAFFFWMGALSLIWLIPWLRLIPPRQDPASRVRTHVSVVSVIRIGAAWVTFTGLFCFNYAFYFLLTWLPSYLVQERKFSLRAMAVYGALPFCATAVASMTAAAWADRRIRRRASTECIRRRVAVTGLLLAATGLSAVAFADGPAAMVCLVGAFIGIGLFTANVWAITQTLAGPDAAASWTGWQNAVGNMGGVVAPILTGWSVSASGSFSAAFLTASGMLVVAAALYGIALGPVRLRTVGSTRYAISFP